MRQLDEIGWTIAQDSPLAAERVVARLATAVTRLADQPNQGRPGRIAGTRELVVPSTPFIVAYRVQANDVEVLTILHGAQAWPETL